MAAAKSDDSMDFHPADCLAAARSLTRDGKMAKAFPWYLLAVQLLKDAEEREAKSKKSSNASHVLESIEAEVVSMFIERSTNLMVTRRLKSRR